jgi:hypothetical protein
LKDIRAGEAWMQRLERAPLVHVKRDPARVKRDLVKQHWKHGVFPQRTHSTESTVYTKGTQEAGRHLRPGGHSNEQDARVDGART